MVSGAYTYRSQRTVTNKERVLKQLWPSGHSKKQQTPGAQSSSESSLVVYHHSCSLRGVDCKPSRDLEGWVPSSPSSFLQPQSTSRALTHVWCPGFCGFPPGNASWSILFLLFIFFSLHRNINSEKKLLLWLLHNFISNA